MRVRVKLNSCRWNLDVPETITIRGIKLEVIKHVAKEILCNSLNVDDLKISLNGKEPITDVDETELSSVGIVHGDLIHVLIEDASKVIQAENTNKGKHVNTGDDQQQKCTTTFENKNEQVCVHANKAAEVHTFLQEGVSQFLLDLYNANMPSTGHDALFLVLKTLMYEGGIKAQIKKDDYHNFTSDNIWSLWKKSGGIYKIPFAFPGYPNPTCSFVCMSVGPYLISNACISGSNQHPFQIKLRVDRFVKRDISLSAGPTKVYQNLAEVSRKFKDKIVLPLLSEIRKSLDLPAPANSMLGLPAEVKFLVLKALDVRTLLNVTQTCKELYFIGNDNEVWRKLCIRDFELPPSQGQYMDWKKEYAQNYRKKKSMLFSQERHLCYPDLSSNDTFLRRYMDEFHIPSIRGGLYDLRPTYPGIPDLSNPFRLDNRMRPRFDPVGPFCNDPASPFGSTSRGLFNQRNRFI